MAADNAGNSSAELTAPLPLPQVTCDIVVVLCSAAITQRACYSTANARLGQFIPVEKEEVCKISSGSSWRALYHTPHHIRAAELPRFAA